MTGRRVIFPDQRFRGDSLGCIVSNEGGVEVSKKRMTELVMMQLLMFDTHYRTMKTTANTNNCRHQHNATLKSSSTL